ncbi:MAG: DUF1206 domain-containing protein [Actinomycetes bacterium]
MPTTTANRAGRTSRKAGRTARRARRSSALTAAARIGLAARGLFYLLLASLAIRIAVDAAGSRQVDPNGALSVVAAQPLGLVVLGAAAFGFAAFAVARLVAAVIAVTGDEREWWDGARALCETVGYTAMATLTMTFVFGHHQEGSEQSHRTFTAKLMGNTGGRALVVAIGVAMIGFYAYQAWIAITGNFENNLDEKKMPGWLQRSTRAVGSGGIAARIITFVPVGIFLIVAAAAHDAHKALGLDATLRDMSRHWWGIAVLSVVAVGLVAFGLYSFVEAAYRKVAKA